MANPLMCVQHNLRIMLLMWTYDKIPQTNIDVNLSMCHPIMLFHMETVLYIIIQAIKLSPRVEQQKWQTPIDVLRLCEI